MYVVTERKNMTTDDAQFLREVGIEAYILEDPFPSSFPPPLPPGPAIPSLTQEDACWLGNLRVAWERDAEPGFERPKTFREIPGPLSKWHKRGCGMGCQASGTFPVRRQSR
jgi:hypothetical protein